MRVCHLWLCWRHKDEQDTDQFSPWGGAVYRVHTCARSSRDVPQDWHAAVHWWKNIFFGGELETLEKVSYERLRLANGGVSLTEYFRMVFTLERQNPFTRSIAIKFKSESYMVLSLSFFIVILVKKKRLKSQAEKKTVTLSKPCCIRDLSICIWIMNTL